MDGPDARATLDPRDPNYDSGDDGTPVQYSLQAAGGGGAPDKLPAFKHAVSRAAFPLRCPCCAGRLLHTCRCVLLADAAPEGVFLPHCGRSRTALLQSEVGACGVIHLVGATTNLLQF